MNNWKNLKKELLKDNKITKEYVELAPHYQLVSDLIRARIKKGLSQKELADRIGTKQSAIARIEAGNANPSIKFLEKMTRAMDSKLVITVR